MATEESIALQKAEAEAAELAVLKSIDERLARIETKLGIVDEVKPDAAPVADPVAAPSVVQPTKPPAFKPVTK